MKHELDDFLRDKEEEFDVPFQEKYWERASAMLEEDRRRSFFARLTGGNILTLVLVLLLIGGTVSYFIFSGTSNNNNNTVATVTTAPGGNNAASSSVNNAGNQTTTNTATENTTTNTTVSNITATNTAATNNNSTVSATSTVNTTTNSNTGNNVMRQTTGVTNNSTVAHRGTTAATTGNGSITNSRNATVNNTPRTNSTTGTPATRQTNNNVQRVEGNLVAIDANTPLYINYHNPSLIPVFEALGKGDKTMAKFYGLPILRSEGNSPNENIRERGQYPKLSVALSGGVNVFRHFAKNTNVDPLVSTNPFIGVKATYLWCEHWFAQAEFDLLQRGAVNTIIPKYDDNTPTNDVYSVRHLYYAQLPVSIGYKFNKKNSVTAGLGIRYLLTSGAQLKNEATGGYKGSYNFEDRGAFNKLDAFVTAGYHYRLNRKISFSVSASCGMLDVTNNSFFSESKSHRNMNFGLGINYSFISEKKLVMR